MYVNNSYSFFNVILIKPVCWFLSNKNIQLTLIFFFVLYQYYIISHNIKKNNSICIFTNKCLLFLPNFSLLLCYINLEVFVYGINLFHCKH